MNWQGLFGVPSGPLENLTAVQCIRALRGCESIQDVDALELIEHLEWLTGHPDIHTYLQESKWHKGLPKSVIQDIMAEVRLLDSLTDDPLDEDMQ
ncbi:hypothetical protein [Echinimonas agarilytica]|uniref:Uncharacterized protein n=1 Tax=Echinimonas agarilytica TaxID=1215918 RepID=A0AA41W6P6_9GAMM|nr:hypothetical protein [Echinimonas agarilytica]MCM2679910.1 hypothetical protein [Echinimonas agarilytica]